MAPPAQAAETQSSDDAPMIPSLMLIGGFTERSKKLAALFSTISHEFEYLPDLPVP